MKKLFAILMATLLILSLVACTNKKQAGNKKSADTAAQGGANTAITEYNPKDLDSMLLAVNKEFEKASQQLSDDTDKLVEEIGDTYKGYLDNKEKISAHHEKNLNTTKALFKNIEAISADYYKCVAANGLDDDKWVDLVDKIFDTCKDARYEYSEAWHNAEEKLSEACDDAISNASKDDETDSVRAEMNKAQDAYRDSIYDAEDVSDETLYNNYTAVFEAFKEGNTDVNDILG